MKTIFSSWPFDNLGVHKYLLYGPLVAKVLYSKPWKERNNFLDLCILHILILCALRGLVHQLWSSFSNMLFLNRRRRIIADAVDFEQIDKEWDWDNFLILDCWIGVIACHYYPSIAQLPEWNPMGVIVSILLHIIVTEPLFYWVHRAFHHGYLFDNYHSMHHSSLVPQPFTAGFATPLEHMVLNVVVGLPLFGACMVGTGSIGLIYGHVLVFDFLRCMGHSNVEIFPNKLFDALPFLKYLIYTPTYHILHHRNKNSNFCLFMPIFDAWGGTLNTSSWQLSKEITSGKNDRVPDFVFLAHVVDVMCSMHVPFVFRTFASMPYSMQPFLILMWPGAFIVMFMMWAWSKTFLASFYHLRGRLHQIWVVPRFGFQYFVPFAKDGINEQIEMAILRADKMGVKVLSLAALNKNESLNGGGTLFLKKYPDLKVRLVHGNTLTAGVILNEIPRDVKQVFLTGATSKIGRAIALYLCRKGVMVLMLTSSTERFKKIQMEAPPEFRDLLVQVTKYKPAQNCKTWIVGKWLTLKEQSWAPSGTHFHQFVVPPIVGFRKDCTYGKLSAMRFPKDVQGLGMCEYTLNRGVAHACHAGGVVHLLEGWTHHEIGPINVDQIDVVWQAALKHGFKPV